MRITRLRRAGADKPEKERSFALICVIRGLICLRRNRARVARGKGCPVGLNSALVTRPVLDIVRRLNVSPQQPCPGLREWVSAHDRFPASATVDVLRRGRPT